ncbi:hypothetical protein LIER_28266 [Lithospermum erythrorhizon]|uniref:Uncharacterized protein n=1 Tax=Lithospermum erythrorhizon TaxID=34254 RepID=A0AAV3RL41_LITER
MNNLLLPSLPIDSESITKPREFVHQKGPGVTIVGETTLATKRQCSNTTKNSSNIQQGTAVAFTIDRKPQRSQSSESRKI